MIQKKKSAPEHSINKTQTIVNNADDSIKPALSEEKKSIDVSIENNVPQQVEVSKPVAKQVPKVSSKKMSFKLSAVKDDKPVAKVDLSNEIKEDESVEINEKVLCSYWSAFADKLSHEANGGYFSSMLARHKPKVVKYNVFQVEVAML